MKSKKEMLPLRRKIKEMTKEQIKIELKRQVDYLIDKSKNTNGKK